MRDDAGYDPGMDAEPDQDARDDEAEATRFEAFAQLAAARARGEMVPLPRHLEGNDRRLHVRQTLREDHRNRITAQDEETAAKFDEVAKSTYKFFRGTCLLFYRDMAGEDAWMPTVLALGDVHPENFGVMPSADNVPIFGVNDFDEAYYAPFTWDLKRGAVGFMLAAEVEGDLGSKKQRKIAERFVRGYCDGIADFRRPEVEEGHQVRLDNAPELIRDLIEDAVQDRNEWLLDDHHDEYRRGFRVDEEHVPVSSRRDEFQDILERLVEQNEITVPDRAGDLRVKDVALRKGAGTQSLGLPRYYVLVEGPRGDGTDDLVIELKRARRSALAGLAPSSINVEGMADRISHAQTVQLTRGDVFYGHVDIDGHSFMARERAPYRDDIDLDDLSKKEWKRYAEICGRALAHAHAGSDDDAGAVGGDVEPRIVEAIGERALFIDDVVRFAEEASDRVRTDHEHFLADHELGAFRRVDRAYL